jgi:hypothetical protein
VRPLTIDPAVLQRAFENTAALLCANVEVAPLPAPSAAPARETHGTVAVFSAVARREITAEQGAELLASPPSDAGTETGGGR